MQLKRARVIAEQIVERLDFYCERIEIAGSIRRQRPQVNDIDLVILPKPGHLLAIKERCAVSCARITDGDQNAIFRLNLNAIESIQLDLFFAHPAASDLLTSTPGSFGSLLLCRTGSKEHNIWLVEHAKRVGRKWNPYHGVYAADGQLIASESEEDIFRALDLEFMPPERRER